MVSLLVIGLPCRLVVGLYARLLVVSSKPADEHEREQVDLFQQEIAESGRLDELLGGVDAGQFEEDEPAVDDPVEDMPDIWMDEFIEE